MRTVREARLECMTELRRLAILHERQGWFQASDILAKAKAEAYLDAAEIVQTCFADLDAREAAAMPAEE